MKRAFHANRRILTMIMSDEKKRAGSKRAMSKYLSRPQNATENENGLIKIWSFYLCTVKVIFLFLVDWIVVAKKRRLSRYH